MYFNYVKGIKFIKIFVEPTSDACIENQLFVTSGMFSHSGSHIEPIKVTVANVFISIIMVNSV